MTNKRFPSSQFGVNAQLAKMKENTLPIIYVWIVRSISCEISRTERVNHLEKLQTYSVEISSIYIIWILSESLDLPDIFHSIKIYNYEKSNQYPYYMNFLVVFQWVVLFDQMVREWSTVLHKFYSTKLFLEKVTSKLFPVCTITLQEICGNSMHVLFNQNKELLQSPC